MTTTALTAGDHAGRFVRTAVGDVYVVVDGDAAADVVVACVHGLPGSARDFSTLGRVLRDRGACCVRFDMPGFGRTPLTTPALSSPTARAQLVIAVMQALGYGRFAIVGHSFGGSVALSAASPSSSSSSPSSASSPVSALAMVCAVGIVRHHGLSVPHELTGLIADIHALPVVGERLGAPLLSFVRNTIGRLGVRGERMASDDELLAHTKMIGDLDFVALRQAAQRLTVPALVVSAQDDKLVQPAASFALAAALSSSSSPLVSHLHRATGGHFLQRRAADAIADWLLLVCASIPIS